MTKYIKIAPDPDTKPCRCGEGNPDCDHFEFCPECGEEYKAHEGHDCLDGFAVAQVGTAKELRDAAKELRDSLDACETERDALRAELERTKEEMERVRRNHLRRMARVSGMRSRELFDEARMTEAEPDCWLRRSSRRLFRLATEARAAIERKDGA